ncbi:flavin reductase family protein [Virgibacillus sp. C22-A2]|uniref:Flavin reductase family protein n=1 Tax=Virgibacillus tibetensis TaxID=3042313 RepID=A0ABU6KKY1_9BACI|nr:flavin reductase family protein [Virgibacillus sp. C22-A2]
MRKPTENTVMHSYPGMVALVTASYNGQNNIMAAGWHSYISFQPPIYGVAIGRQRYTYDLVKNAESFAINFLAHDQAAFIQQAGVYTGEDLNKFAQGGPAYDQGITISAPILRDAYVAYECKTIDINTYGDHDWVVGEITQCYRDEKMFLKNGLPDFEKLEIPLYLGRSKYAKLDRNSSIHTYKVEE